MSNFTKKLIISGKDVSEFVIVLGKESSPSEKNAANELQSYIEKTTSHKLDIVCDCTSPRECEIIVGKTNREEHLNIDREKLGNEGYVIAVLGTKLYIAGGQKRGTLYGVYDFLEKYLGWRFFTLTLEKCKASDTIEITDGLYDEKIPILEYRELDWICARDKHWAVKAKINGSYRQFGEEFGGELKWGGAIHSIGKYLGAKQLSEQPCLSDPENIKKVIEQVGVELEANPDLDIFEISQNDNQNYCKCEKCAKIDEEEGSHAATFIRLINALSDAYREKYPKLHFQTFAYQYTRKPPKLTKPRENVIIKLCPIECCYSHTFDDPSCNDNRAFKEDLEGWNEICEKVYIWDYATNYAYFIAPFPNFETMRLNLQFLVNNSVKGYYPEANYIFPSGEFAELRSYLHSKIMWDPYMEKEEYYAHMDEFLEAYYGPGWKNIRKFINFTMEESSKRHFDLWSHPSLVIPMETYKEHLGELKGYWNDAKQAAKDAGMNDVLENISRSELQFTLIRLSIEHEERYEKGDKESRKLYCFENQMFYNELVRKNIGWREAFPFPPKTDFTRPPLEWSNPHTYGLPEED